MNDHISDLTDRLAVCGNKSREQERLTGEKIQSVKESEWAKSSELQENRITLETRITELEAILTGRETEFSLQIEQSQDRVISLETELAGSLRNREQLDDQLKEVVMHSFDIFTHMEYIAFPDERAGFRAQ